ncbi:MAG: hypothetical protein LQ338_004787 [Usnochroma carphineum]|nr:MAG: hypothetical protein LQ338_004787 [Usnochroma carphineum]
MLQYVRTLAEIQASPFQPNAPVRSSEVFSFTGGSRRKRSEIALTVDNHSVGIYDLRSGNIVASYAVSPATSFTCPPSSIKLSKSGSTEARKITYCSVLDPQPKLLRFVEESRRKVLLGGPLETSALNLPENSSSVVYVEALPNNPSETEALSIDVLCVSEDGTVRCYDEALTAERWHARIASTRNGEGKTPRSHVVHTSALSIQQARQTILKHREDLLGILDAVHGVYAPNLLLLFTRSGDSTLTFHVLATKILEATDSQALLLDASMVEELASFMIPEPKDVRGKEASFRLHTSSGSLYQGTAGKLCIYDLTSLAPRLVQTMKFPNAKGVLSYIRISSDVIATIAPDSIFLVDTRFSSFQERYTLPMPKQARNKLPHDIESMLKSPILGTAGAQLLSYHSPSSSAIVLLGRSLIAVDVSKTVASRGTSRKRKRTGLLIDAVGRGSISVEESQPSRKSGANMPRVLGQALHPYHDTPEWENQRKALDALSQKGDVLEWDLAMVSALEDGRISFDKTSATAPPPAYKVDYVLATNFSATSMEDVTNRPDDRFLSQLHLQYFPEKTFRFLANKGLVTIERITAALKRQNKMHYNHTFKDYALMKALADHDDTMATLLSMLQSPCLLKVSELCHALKITAARSPSSAAPNSPKLLTEGNDNGDQRTNSSDRMDLDHVRFNHTSDNSNTSDALLDAILSRCNACPTFLLTKTLKTHFSKPELRDIIHLLRIKLARSGWLLPYTEENHNTHPAKPCPNNQLSTIGKLLNCCVDGLGAGGWVLDNVNNNNNNDIAGSSEAALETVSFMKAEISAAVAGVEEATFLQGILGEMLLCGKSALHQQQQPANRPMEPGNNSAAALPLGLKLEQNISLTKVGAGGELQKRTRRDIGKLKSRKVPEYSFERIAI